MAQLLTVDDVAARLAIHRMTVYQLIWAGHIAWVNVAVGKRPRIRIEEAEIDRFIKQRTQR